MTNYNETPERGRGAPQLINPANRWFDWHNDGFIKYYDKDKKEQMKVTLPFDFVVLDVWCTVSGYSDSDQSGIWSNEISDVRKHILTVRTKKGTIASGLWKDIKQAVDNNGGGFAQSIYVLYKEGNDVLLGNLKFSGAALKSWFDFTKGRNIYEGAFSIKDFTSHKKGKVDYTMPVFTAKPISENANQLAIDENKELQKYLKEYLVRSQEHQQEEAVKEVVAEENNRRATEPVLGNTTTNTPYEPQAEIETNHIGDDDLPF